MPSSRPIALLVCSNGGHLLQLMRLLPLVEKQYEVQWVTFRKADALSLLEGQKVHWAAHPTNRNIPNLCRNLLLAIKLFVTLRPRRILSTGAGVALPFFALSLLWPGCHSCYIESFARFSSPSLTGRLLYPLANCFLYQWPELRRFYPKGIYSGSIY